MQVANQKVVVAQFVLFAGEARALSASAVAKNSIFSSPVSAARLCGTQTRVPFHGTDVG